ncbi:ABC transporter ATP-binding protein, partial [Bacillus thuringiensis]|nr:ABC transporter ATP-binding protein [Bacillus thuringiensis]
AIDFEEGEIFIDGHSVKKDPIACKRVMAYIPDNPDLYEQLTGIQYLNFVADVFKVPARDREEQIQKYGNAFEITPYLGDLI